MNVSETLGNPNGVFGSVDYMVFLIMLGVSTAIGIYFGFFGGENGQTTEEYLLGGRKMKTFPIAISLIASQLSGVSIISVPSEMYTYGAQYWVIVPTMIIITLIINYIFIPVFYKNQITNCYQYLEDRFCPKVRKFVTLTYVLNVYWILPIFIFVPAMAFSQMAGINIHLINALVCFVCTFYTMLGGIKAVVWTDVVQGGMMLFSCVLVVVMGVLKIGGLSEVYERASAGNRLDIFNMSFDLTSRATFWNESIGNIFLWTGYIGLSQTCVQRIVSVPTMKHARSALTIFCVGFMIIMTLNCFTGIVIFAKYHDCDPIRVKLIEKGDRLLPFFVHDIVGHLKGVPGIFISCIFSAGLSTMSANLNSLSGIIYEDYVRPLKLVKHSDRAANMIMKMLVLVSGVYCVLMGLVVEKYEHILQMVMSIASVTQGAVLGVFCLGMLWPWANKKGALWGSVASVITVAWIMAGSFLIKHRYPKLPTSVEGCDKYGYNVTMLQNNAFSLIQEPIDDSFSMYKIAFPWYSAIGTLIVIIVGVIVSYFTGSVDPRSLKIELLAPIAQYLLPKDMLEYEIKLKTKNWIDDEKSPEVKYEDEWKYRTVDLDAEEAISLNEEKV